jgi:thiol:disulfide interchange protein DsbD
MAKQLFPHVMRCRKGVLMRLPNMLLLVWLICSTAWRVEAQFALNNSSQQVPDVQAWSVENSVPVDDTGSGTVRIAVEIPPDHHGYLDRGDEGYFVPLTFTFSSLVERGARVVPIAHPTGIRDDQVHATILRGQGEFVFRFESLTAEQLPKTSLPATLQYQICNDITNICYPPRTTEVPINLVSATIGQHSGSAPTQTDPLPHTSLTLRERIDRLFQRYQDHVIPALGLVFLAGLIAAATPCVYPIIPITAAILMARGQGSPRRGRVHAVVYFAGIIVFYTLLGFFAATLGAALSTVMTTAWANLGFAVLAAYFGLSMLGLYEFQFLPTLTERLDTVSSRYGGFTGTFFMGSTAGLIVSPCIGPVVGALLITITQQAMGRGILLMAGFGVGLGLPILLVGLLSSRLPQSGSWLTKVKFVLGIFILYFAYTYFTKATDTAGLPSDVAHAILIGILAIASAVFIGAFHPLGESPPSSLLLRRACGIILLIVGTHFLYNGLGHSGILIAPTGKPARSSATQLSQVEVHGNLHWLRDFAVAQQRASQEQKPLFIDFYATWCANCREFGRLAVKHASLNQALQQAVLVKIYDSDTIFQTFQQDQRFPELRGVGGQPFLPLFAIFSSQGTFLWKGQNYQAADTMIAQLEQAKSK